MTDLMRTVVSCVLENPHNWDWTVQGFGMLRTYLDSDRKRRLNIWDKRLATPNVSLIHDHPWDFRSFILAGHLMNVRFVDDPLGQLFEYAKIQCGPNGGMCPSSAKNTIRLRAYSNEIYRAHETYEQKAEEIHLTDFTDGTVTLNVRNFRPDTEHARVFWTAGQQWVDAKPRAAADYEVEAVVSNALKIFRSDS